jgi:thiamine biosynthesis protein ThiI
LTTEPSFEDVASVCAALAQNFVFDGEFFAIRARKSGNHPFSSVDITKACGDAVWNSMEKKGKRPRVNLTSPNKEIFVEMRQNLAYICLNIVKGVGELLLGT